MDPHQYTAKFEALGGEPILHAYPDPLTRGEPYTIGLGSTGPDIKRDTSWSREQCLHRFYNDYAIASSAASGLVGSGIWRHLNEPRQSAITDLAYNLGQVRLGGFHNMLDAVRRADWRVAHDELLESNYATQVHGRAQSNASILLTGLWPTEAVA